MKRLFFIALMACQMQVLAKSADEILASGSEPKALGLAIATEADNRDLGFKDSQIDMEMILRNPHGQESTRNMRMMILETPDKALGDKSLIVFDNPRDIKGTALLTFSKILEPDDQWLYLPALKRVKRISSRNKSGSFVGSEFAYEDLSSQEVGKYDYKYLRQETCGDLDCFVFERYPLYENSGYTKQIVWMDTKHFRVQKTEFYDRKKALLKTLTMHGYAQYLNKHWRAAKMSMINHQTKKSTDLLWNQYEFQTGLSDDDFTTQKLKRIR